MFTKNKAVKYLIFSIIAFSFLFFTGIELFADPTALLCNGIINPDGITNPELDDYTPFFSWTFYNSGTGDYQTAYQIRIDTTAGGSDIWLSAEISSLTENCAYFGPQLNPNVTYHWSVRVQDQNTNWSVYSADATFRILDIGLRAYDGETVKIAVDQITNATYALRIRKSGVTYGIRLTDPVNSDASKIIIQTNSGIKALKKMDVTADLPSPAIIDILMGIYNSAQSFTITGEAGATIEYSTDNGGTWLIYLSMVTLNTEGEYNIIARQTDSEGEMSAQTSPAIYIKIDLTAPDVVLTDDHADSIVTDTDTVIITATFTEADEINEVTVPKISIGSVVTNTDMTKVSNLVWTYEWNVPSGNDGTHNVSIAATDRAGNNNTTATGQTSYTIDNTPPTQPGTPTTTTPTTDTTPTWTWTASVDNGSGLRTTNTYQVFWDTVSGGETYSAFTNTNSYTHSTALALGTWYFKVKAFDNLNHESSFSAAGNVTLIQPLSVTYNGNGATGGSVPTDSNDYVPGDTVTVLGNSGGLVKTGYNLAGWNTMATGLGTSYAIGASFSMGASDVTLYAIWIPDYLTFTSSGTTITITGYTTAPTGSLIIPGGVTRLGVNAFKSCSGLTSVTIPASVTRIEQVAFQVCTGLTSIFIPSSVTYIESTAFYGCTGITSFTVDAANTTYMSISGVIFSKDGTRLHLAPGGLSGSYTIPAGVTIIGWRAFFRCRNLTSVTIPSGVTTIEWQAFRECSGLTSVNIPASVSSFDEGAFLECSNLTAINVDSANLTYKSIAGVVFSKDGTVLVEMPQAKTGSYSVPAGVTTIFWSAFMYSNLSSITLPSGVIDIQSYAFAFTRNITTFTIPSSVTSIGEYAFEGMNSLTSITIPHNVTFIDRFAFYGSGNLSSVTILAITPPAVDTSAPGWKAFDYCDPGLQIHVPAGSLTAYKTAAGWSDYASIIVSP